MESKPSALSNVVLSVTKQQRANGTTITRPKAPSQASFDWFGKYEDRVIPPYNHSSSRANSTHAPPSDSGASTPAASYLPSFTTTPPQEDDDLNQGPSTDQDEGYKGAFTSEEMKRGGAKMRRQITEGSPSASNARKPSPIEMFKRGRRASSYTGRNDSIGFANAGEERDTFGQTSDNHPLGTPLASKGRHLLWHPSRKANSNAGDSDGELASGASSNTHLPISGPSTSTSPKKSRPSQMRRATTTGWGMIRNKLRPGAAAEEKEKEKEIGRGLGGHELINELSNGMLPLVLVKMSVMDRDEHGDPRIPVLLNYLKLKITDSIYPFHTSHSVFRIELSYGDSLLRWVIYRELKDFVNLHAHFRVANLRKGIDKFPKFPKTSLPYLGWLKAEGLNATTGAEGASGTKGPRGKEIGKEVFAKAQRESLEKYLLKLVRATMFGPGANRLCKFLEISAMSIALSQKGQEQGKQGYLRIMSAASRHKEQGFHPFSWKKRHDPKWFLVRDSYILAVADPASTEIYDVFLIDASFEIERPKRVFRQGFNLLSRYNPDHSEDEDLDPDSPEQQALKNSAKPQGKFGAGDPLDPSTTNLAASDPNRLRDSSNHTFYLKSSERKLRLVAKTERQQDQFIASIEKMVGNSIWAGRNRFDSFAPIRLNVSAQWLIDGRDYFWSLSRAIMLAKETIYIHDWWLSPTLHLRRPAHENLKWRLDKLLQRKAREGVKIFVIIYKEVSNDFTPVDSTYTKTTLRGLHPNIHVQRSPSHTSTGTLLWSHHEKMCVIDSIVGFMGGIDLCFGRWDTPGHVLVDDGPNALNLDDPQNADKNMSEEAQIWPGKDYANSRVVDFHDLDKPDDDMYDRGKVPRQPWHDIGVQIIGQPARDLCRHFIQRWNLLLRTKNHTVKMPFLIPAPDFTLQQLQEQRITGTCEVQICRSAGPWSMGISEVEHSIQNAYIKAIELSEHFVYIENQFFITSTVVEGTAIENQIGDALVSRILKAHSEGTPWRAVIVIPLVPGYPFPIDHSDAGSVRLIMECQNRTICRGEHSIFARLRREGIDPDEYITFFGLRGWGKLSSGALTTEAVYIHAKAMIVDDRTVIIGSANINERSQRGERDSELACIIRDTDMMDSTMGGVPYKVGRFAHTMRVRLMREHLGVDVDELEAEESDSDLLDREPADLQEPQDAWDPDHEQTSGIEGGATKKGHTAGWALRMAESAKANVGSVARGATEVVGLGLTEGEGAVGRGLDKVVDDAEGATKSRKADDQETSASKIIDGKQGSSGFASSVVPTLEEKVMMEQRPSEEHTEEDGVKQGRTPNQKEREDGVATQIPGQEEGGKKGGSGSRVVDKIAKSLGGETTQSSKYDDTRKLPMEENAYVEKDGEKIRPLAPTTSHPDDGPSRILDSAPPPDLDPKFSKEEDKRDAGTLNNNEGSTSASTISKKDKILSKLSISTTLDSHSEEEEDFPTTSRSPPTSPQSPRTKANAQAVNRNTVTSTLRKNLREKVNAYTIPVKAPVVDAKAFGDPLVDSFFKEVWLACAVRNTQAYRKVFRCVPDDLVQNWKQYREFQTWADRHNKAPKDATPPGDPAPYSDPSHSSGTHGSGGGGSGGGSMGQGADELPKGETVFAQNHQGGKEGSSGGAGGGTAPTDRKSGGDLPSFHGRRRDASTSSGGAGLNSSTSGASSNGGGAGGEGHDHEDGFPASEREQMEECLLEVRGHLVVYPTRFLEAESDNGNFL